MNKLYGSETEKARENFLLQFGITDLEIIFSIATVKKAAAMAYRELLPEKAAIYTAIEKACDMILECEKEHEAGKDITEILLKNHPVGEVFVVDALQGGAGTSTHMNVNEVIATLANGISQTESDYKTSYDIETDCKQQTQSAGVGGKSQTQNAGVGGKSQTQNEKDDGKNEMVHPLDDVNRGQSTNDVYPTALRIAAVKLLRKLREECHELKSSLQKKEKEFENIEKLGRTQLMDAVSITLGGEFGAYAQAIDRDIQRLDRIEEHLLQTNLGGTAVGDGSNAADQYSDLIMKNLRAITNINLIRDHYPVDVTQNQDVFAEASGLLKALAVNLIKISNDLRLMNSGPHGGLGEISLAAVQKGSTIMPGKVNPVMAEMIQQVSMKVMANDYLITIAAAKGEFELNPFVPAIADSLLESLRILKNGIRLFRTKCIDLLEANEERCREILDNSFAFATSYTKKLGYDVVSEVVKKHGESPKRVKKELEKMAGRK